ncbi:MAG: hypothetical protein ABH858_00915 [Candidatus Omnitrophota bacterium]
MKKNYLVCGDIFIAVAFSTFIIGTVVRLLNIKTIFLGITPGHLWKLSVWCILFSIALSLIDLASKKQNG